ncbi:NAD(P)/FAD-dependent oxidoreductase [Coprothermobacter platensis]|uniref:NAD(P)/FAD-dependent oxidoreductase n=1 Tax=Coprothermobacter platensis TaxID=108819 RepID=UPI00035E7FAF|nr:FAD-binding oxidoreductase [Coprothermobacter platensis]
MTYDIIIVGGGIQGVATAYELAKRGAGKILLLEKTFLTGGSTGSCAAGIRAQFGSPFNVKLMARSLEIFENMAKELECDNDYLELWQGGYLVLAYSEAEFEGLKRNVEVQHTYGLKTNVLSVEEVKKAFPRVNVEGVYGATYHDRDGHADPFHVTFAYAEAGKRLGVEIREWTPVDTLLTENGKITGVRLQDGSSVYAERVLVCAGAWTTSLLKTVGIDLPLWGEKHEILITEPWERLLGPMVISFSRGYYIQQRPHGSFIMGIPPEDPRHWYRPDEFDFSSSIDFLLRMSSEATNVLPFLKGVNVVRQWAGLYEMTPDHHHAIGPLEDISGLWVAAGGSGHGFMFGPVMAEQLSKWMMGEPMDIDLRPLSPDRFKKGALVIEPAVVG